MADSNGKITVVDLFCGCGGLSLGFIKAGYCVILSVDNDDTALSTFKANHPGVLAVNIDLANRNAVKQIRQSTKPHSIDVVVAGPPCQGFSLTGPRNFDDERNRLYLAVIRMVSKLQPQAFIIENVPGLATLYNGAIKDEIIRRFENLGYSVNHKILCAADYGVPQMRRRIFFVGLRENIGKFVFPEPTHSFQSYITCEEAIGDLPNCENGNGNGKMGYPTAPKSAYQRLMRGNSKVIYNHEMTKHTDLVKNVIALVPEGGDYRNLPPGVGESRRFNEAWTRYHSRKPSPTIDTGHRNHFHYRYDRVPTIRENARLQSFPDSFVFYGTKTHQNRQVGNAVPPLLSFHIAKKLKAFLKK